MIRDKKNTPEANILMNSMRAMGYTFESAIADVIDNSICAYATIVKVFIPSSRKEKCICIFDNGKGMDENELLEAMKYGSNIGERQTHDLGRFGLGLKSASLSQCRLLTVVSKKNSIVSALQWDLDYVEEKKDWLVKVLSMEEIQTYPYIDNLLKIEHGTCVYWENFDTIDTSKESEFTCLARKMPSLEKHLSLVFHRFMDATEGTPVSFYINFNKIAPLDPFLSNHKKTTKNEIIDIPIRDSRGIERLVTAQAFILPHICDLSPKDKDLLGGVDTMKTQQGFYVYRNRRLIIGGSWFGMPKDELNKYARIKVDIPNTLDDIWHIDIKKQHATIPSLVKDRLKKAIEKAQGQSEKKSSFRGTKKKNDVRLWYPTDNRGVPVFRINRSASIFELLKGVDEKSHQLFDTVLDEIEKMIPYNDIYLAVAHGSIITKKDQQLSNERLSELESEAVLIANQLYCQGVIDKEEIFKIIFSTEPFCDHKAEILARLNNTEEDPQNA